MQHKNEGGTAGRSAAGAGRRAAGADKGLKGFSKIRYIFFLIKPYWKYGKLYMIITIGMAAVFSPLSTLLMTLLPQRAIDALMAGKDRMEVLKVIGLYTLAIALIAGLKELWEHGYSHLKRQQINMRIRNDVNEKALFTDYKYYDNPEFFKKFLYAQEEYPDHASMVMWFFPRVITGVVTIAAMTSLIASTGPVLLGVTLAFVVLGGVIILPTLKPEADIRVHWNDNWRPIEYATRLLKQKENAAELRSSGAGMKFLRTVDSVIGRNQTAYRAYKKKTLPFYLAKETVAPIQTACILAYIILFVIGGDTTKIGLYASLTVASAALASNLETVFDCVKDMLQWMLHGERIAAFFEAESVIEPPCEGMAPPPEGVYDIEFRDVSFGYENAAFAIEHLDLHIQPGQRAAIVGENGAGKTTLTKLLLRLYDVTGGAVLINGKDIRDYEIHALRLHIGIAFQDVRILAMSLRDNLTVYHELPDETLMEVIRQIGLEGVVEKAKGENADDPDADKLALDKMVSREFTEDGVALSGGEAQRLSLARLFTGPFGLLVLDEPSSALDPLAEHRIMQIILDASNTATTLMIAHRLSTVRDFDVIYHMDNGKIIESGTHDELMAARGKYCEMFTRQAENYQDSSIAD